MESRIFLLPRGWDYLRQMMYTLVQSDGLSKSILVSSYQKFVTCVVLVCIIPKVQIMGFIMQRSYRRIGRKR
ncbi:hypothetical protein BDV41DRAFT_170828 [Aspergillus transmontanensis]|uniref:Uncharacterized protein n=1 Tax=Aspergillus transmontanensis TaxID=1034304 RepID=A0A5N6WJ99_9EURO|nr:hypothetical protein BDV41DRAFT_170828 [Aspergillus transmontanensis]